VVTSPPARSAEATNGKRGSADNDVIHSADRRHAGSGHGPFPSALSIFHLVVLLESPILISRAASPAVLPWEVNFRMHNAHVPCESVAAGKEFFFLAERASGLLLADVVDRILVPGEIVRP